jgi:hypothetical protein
MFGNRMEKKKGAREMTVAEMTSLGGRARAKKLSPKRRKEIAQKAAAARWKK